MNSRGDIDRWVRGVPTRALSMCVFSDSRVDVVYRVILYQLVSAHDLCQNICLFIGAFRWYHLQSAFIHVTFMLTSAGSSVGARR
jgi:hypothetical protein